MRISVDRMTREMSDAAMIVTMNQAAISMPSGCCQMLTATV